jgi:hypothetical protein
MPPSVWGVCHDSEYDVCYNPCYGVCYQGCQCGCGRTENGIAVLSVDHSESCAVMDKQLRAAVVFVCDDQPSNRRTNQSRRLLLPRRLSLCYKNVPPPPPLPGGVTERCFVYLSELSLTVRRSFHFISYTKRCTILTNASSYFIHTYMFRSLLRWWSGYKMSRFSLLDINELQMFCIGALKDYFNICGIPINAQYSNMLYHIVLIAKCFGRKSGNTTQFENMSILSIKWILKPANRISFTVAWVCERLLC